MRKRTPTNARRFKRRIHKQDGLKMKEEPKKKRLTIVRIGQPDDLTDRSWEQ